MRILLDMNLSPAWAPALRQAGHECLHWSEVGAHNASDRVILEWARLNRYVVFTHDLDFGAILAATQGLAPSVIQLRIQDTAPETSLEALCLAVSRFREHLEQGALVTVDEDRARVRILPLKQG